MLSKLADEGRRVLTAAHPVARRVDERVLEVLPDKQRDAFLTALVSIVEALESFDAVHVEKPSSSVASD